MNNDARAVLSQAFLLVVHVQAGDARSRVTGLYQAVTSGYPEQIAPPMNIQAIHPADAAVVGRDVPPRRCRAI